MSLLEDAFESFTIVNKALVPDGYGGVTTSYTDGAVIQGALSDETNTQVKIAQALGVKDVFKFTVRKDIFLDYHTVIRRNSDSSVFRITSDTDEYDTPQSAGLNMRQYDCERWALA